MIEFSLEACSKPSLFIILLYPVCIQIFVTLCSVFCYFVFGFANSYLANSYPDLVSLVTAIYTKNV